MKTLLQISRVIIVAIALMIAWNFPLVESLVTPVFARQAAPASAASQADSTFVYSKLGIEAPITIAPNSSPMNSQNWGAIRDALKHGVSVAYAGSDFATAPLVYVSGHSSDTYPHPFSSVFAGLGQAKVGDTFSLKVNNILYTYKVVGQEQVSPTNVTEFPHLAETMRQESPQVVELVTCWPVLTTARRLVTVGVLIK